MRPNEIGDGRGEGVRRLHERRGMGGMKSYTGQGEGGGVGGLGS